VIKTSTYLEGHLKGPPKRWERVKFFQVLEKKDEKIQSSADTVQIRKQLLFLKSQLGSGVSGKNSQARKSNREAYGGLR